MTDDKPIHLSRFGDNRRGHRRRRLASRVRAFFTCGPAQQQHFPTYWMVRFGIEFIKSEHCDRGLDFANVGSALWKDNVESCFKFIFFDFSMPSNDY